MVLKHDAAAQSVDILSNAELPAQESLSQFRRLTVDLPPHPNVDGGPGIIHINHGTLSGALTLTLNRTVRVPDNQDANMLPPSLGLFPLFKVQDHAKRMPPDMAAKGGLFFPMYQREAMWINFSASRPFALKVYVGGVNAVSGLPMRESEQTRQKRLRMLRDDGRPVQDYMVVPGQRWLDGIVSEDGRIRQFVAKPKGSGFGVEVQVTGEEKVGGVQIEIIPARFAAPREIDVRYENKQRQVIKRTLVLADKGLSAESTVYGLRRVLQDEFDIAIRDQILEAESYHHDMYQHLSTEEDKAKDINLGSLCFKPSMTLMLSHSEPAPDIDFSAVVPMSEMPIDLSLDCITYSSDSHYGAPAPDLDAQIGFVSEAAVPPPPGAPMVVSMFRSSRSAALRKASAVKEMGLAAGGLIQQTIEPDTFPPETWDEDASILLNLQILDSEAFTEVTGLPPPPTPVDAQTYRDHGFPFFEIWGEEKTGVKGDFGEVKSVAQIEAERARERGEEAVEEPSVPQRVHVIGHFRSAFRPVDVLMKELDGLELEH